MDYKKTKIGAAVGFTIGWLGSGLGIHLVEKKRNDETCHAKLYTSLNFGAPLVLGTVGAGVGYAFDRKETKIKQE